MKRDEVGSILQKYHDDPLFGSHQGRDKMLAAIQKNFYWFGMKKDIEDYYKKMRDMHQIQTNGNQTSTHTYSFKETA